MGGVVVDLVDKFLRRQRILRGNQLRLKHLPGKHDQKSHTPKKYGRGVAAEPIPEDRRIYPGENRWFVGDIKESGAYEDKIDDANKQAVVQGIGALPIAHQQAVKGVEVWGTRTLGSDPEYPWEGSNAAGQADWANGRVHLAANEDLRFATVRSSTTHEVGHVVLGWYSSRNNVNTAMRTKAIELRTKMSKLYDDKVTVSPKTGVNPKMISSYARTDHEEYIAETYGAYVWKPHTLKRVDPEGYAAMRDFFDGQEYLEYREN